MLGNSSMLEAFGEGLLREKKKKTVVGGLESETEGHVRSQASTQRQMSKRQSLRPGEDGA